MSLFGRNGTAAATPAAQDAEVISPGGPPTGIMMMFRALSMTMGIDPTLLGAKLSEFEAIIKTTLQALLAKAESFDLSLAAIRLRQEEQEVRSDANLAAISAALADIAERLQHVYVSKPAGPVRIAAAKRTSKAN